MKRTPLLLVAVCAFACKGRGDPPAADKAPPPVASTSATAKAGAGFDTAAAKVALPTTQSSPETKKARFGPSEVTIDVCALDTAAPPLAASGWDDALKSMAVTADGTIYVLDHENKIRRYVNRVKRGCELVLDPRFGDKGVLDASLGDGYALATDAAGVLYATSGGIGMKSKRIAGGKVAEHCDGTLRVQPSSSLAVLSGNRLLEDGCKGKSISFHDGFDPKSPEWASPRVVGLFGDEIVVRGMDLEGGKEIRKVGLHGADGKQRIKLGRATGDESMWSPDAATTCADDLCVFDMTRGGASLLRWKKDGSFVQKLKLDVVDFAGRSLGASGGSLWVAGGASAKGSGIVGVVIRVAGVE